MAVARARWLKLSRSTKPSGRAVQGLAPRRPRCRSIQSGHGSAKRNKFCFCPTSGLLQISVRYLSWFWWSHYVHTSGALKFQKGNHIGNSLMIFYAFLGLFAKKTDCLDLLDKFDKSTGEGNKIPVRPVPFHGIHLLYVGPSRSGWAHQTAFSIDSIGTSRKVNFLDRNIRQTCLSMSEDV